MKETASFLHGGIGQRHFFLMCALYEHTVRVFFDTKLLVLMATCGIVSSALHLGVNPPVFM